MNKIWQKALFFLLFIWSTAIFAHASKDLKDLTVVLDWFVNPNHAPLFVADQEGFFAKQGLRIKFITPAVALEGEKMVAANRADIALTYQPALSYHVARKLPIIRFATLIDRPLNCLVVLQDGPVHSLQDLAGKRFGSSASEIDNIIFSTMLASVNLKLKDVKVTNVGFNLVSALLTKQIDGFTGGMRNFEPLVIEQAQKTPLIFYPEDYGFPQYDELIFVTNKNKINDPVLIAFTAAVKVGVVYLRKNPLGSWKKFAVLHPELNNSLNKKAWFATLPYFAHDPAKLNQKRYEKLMQFMVKDKPSLYLPKIAEYAVER
jgi:putative hydroxymethylpyrimidine transport system substrate-binding protein